MYYLLFYYFFLVSCLKYFKLHLDDSSHLQKTWAITKIHITLILLILICAHHGASGHLLKEHLGLIWNALSKMTFVGTWWMPGSTIASTAAQRAKSLRQRERETPEVSCPRDNTLPLGSQESASGAVSSDITQGVCEEWQTHVRARALN